MKQIIKCERCDKQTKTVRHYGFTVDKDLCARCFRKLIEVEA